MNLKEEKFIIAHSIRKKYYCLGFNYRFSNIIGAFDDSTMTIGGLIIGFVFGIVLVAGVLARSKIGEGYDVDTSEYRESSREENLNYPDNIESE